MIWKSSLSKRRQELLELCQSINHGRVENFPVRGGDPILDPRPRIIRRFKFPGDNGSRPEAMLPDYVLTDKVKAMVEAFDQLKDATILWLEINGGLPLTMEVEEPGA